MTFLKTSMTAIGLLTTMAVVSPLLLATPVGAQSSSSSTYSSAPSSTPPNSSEPPGNPNGGAGGNGGDIPPPPTDQQISKLEETCNGALAQLAKVREKQVAAFSNPGGVTVKPVCNNGLGRQAKIDASQALPLQHAIAKNPALMAALQARGFHAEDVVGVVLVNGVATLYVHKGASA